MRVLVVPSCRAEQWNQFCDAWEGRGGWDRVVLVEDSPRRTMDPRGALHFSHAEIVDRLGGNAWVISRGDSACRAFGFIVAHDMGADYVLTLDDDVRPRDGNHDPFIRHVSNMEHYPRWVSSVHDGMRVRGLPYRECGLRTDVVVSVGLWSGVPDLDGETSVARGCPTDYEPPRGRRLLAPGEYAPICGMNLACARRAIPLMYFGLQGVGYPYRRFDDIWMGVVMKRALDHLGWRCCVGEPHVHHSRASDPVTNREKERPGLEMNERFWQVVDAAPISCDARGAVDCMDDVGDHLMWTGDAYLAKLGMAIRTWARLFVP